MFQAQCSFTRVRLRNRRIPAIAAVLLAILPCGTFNQTATAGELPVPAVTANTAAPAQFLLNAGRTAGYQFTVADFLEVTHLGLFDDDGNGLQLSYPVAIWNQAGEMVALAEIPSGTAAPLISGFRYVAASGPPTMQGRPLVGALPILVPDELYTIGYFASAVAPNDRMISFAGWHEMHPLITQWGGAVSTGIAHPSIMMPDQPFTGFDYWIGPSFQFNVVPGPGGIGILMLAMLSAGARNRRR